MARKVGQIIGTRRPQMVHPGLSRPRPRNQETQLPQPNQSAAQCGKRNIFDEEVARTSADLVHYAIAHGLLSFEDRSSE